MKLVNDLIDEFELESCFFSDEFCYDEKNTEFYSFSKNGVTVNFNLYEQNNVKTFFFQDQKNISGFCVLESLYLALSDEKMDDYFCIYDSLSSTFAESVKTEKAIVSKLQEKKNIFLKRFFTEKLNIQNVAVTSESKDEFFFKASFANNPSKNYITFSFDKIEKKFKLHSEHRRFLKEEISKIEFFLQKSNKSLFITKENVWGQTLLHIIILYCLIDVFKESEYYKMKKLFNSNFLVEDISD